MNLTINFDGGNERNIAIWSFVYTDGAGFEGSQAGQVPIDLPQTNNVAEWSALFHAMRFAETHKERFNKYLFRGDSELVIKQIKGIYACTKPHLKPFFEQCRTMRNSLYFGHNIDCEFEHVRREFNKAADLAGRVLRDSLDKSK
jgi:ribonuclease HI